MPASKRSRFCNELARTLDRARRRKRKWPAGTSAAGRFARAGAVKHPDLHDISSDLSLMQGGVTRLGNRGRKKRNGPPGNPRRAALGASAWGQAVRLWLRYARMSGAPIREKGVRITKRPPSHPGGRPTGHANG